MILLFVNSYNCLLVLNLSCLIRLCMQRARTDKNRVIMICQKSAVEFV